MISLFITQNCKKVYILSVYLIINLIKKAIFVKYVKEGI